MFKDMKQFILAAAVVVSTSVGAAGASVPGDMQLPSWHDIAQDQVQMQGFLSAVVTQMIELVQNARAKVAASKKSDDMQTACVHAFDACIAEITKLRAKQQQFEQYPQMLLPIAKNASQGALSPEALVKFIEVQNVILDQAIDVVHHVADLTRYAAGASLMPWEDVAIWQDLVTIAVWASEKQVAVSAIQQAIYQYTLLTFSVGSAAPQGQPVEPAPKSGTKNAASRLLGK